MRQAGRKARRSAHRGLTELQRGSQGAPKHTWPKATTGKPARGATTARPDPCSSGGPRGARAYSARQD
eukprot:2220754-Pyramimonas_sp.AAC.1